jgi:hypothetical protein
VSRTGLGRCLHAMFAFVQYLRRFRLVCMTVEERHGHGGRRYKPGCESCRVEAAERKRALRARKRGLAPLPPLPAEEPADAPEPAAGPVVLAVTADLASLGDLTGWRALAAGALAMARILDDPRQVTTQPSAVRQLMSLMGVLRREAAPRPGRLAAVQALSTSAQPR